MKRKIGKINIEPLFEAIGIICKEYNEKHKDDPIVEVTAQFKLAERARIKAESAMNNLQKISIEVRELNK